MLYAILCYGQEAVINTWSRETEDAVLAKRDVVKKDLAAQDKLGPVARLMPTKSATTVRVGRKTVVSDGPFAETKEQLLGFYVVECETVDEAVEVAKRMGNEGGALEIRPIRNFLPADHKVRSAVS